ncbi:hypothetical protein [Hymenobacter sp. BT190]|uniref:hypothetical protein n=1 Tax=Hymenobacter sp. BT190 TaxID=2763505 RepID=UPI0016516D76|nr:hypothetical protein [Hymenobacter sp. BT190]MBC6697757.1 hypothetical protein [Hymenobacter sp. BT190]
MRKKLLLLGALTLVLPACNLLCGDCCDLRPPGNYDITGTLLVALGTSTGRTATVLAANAPVRAMELRLQLGLDTRMVAAHRPVGVSGVAYACSPLEPGFTEQLDSLAITSRFDFDALHPAGTSLNDVLTTFDWSESLNDYLRVQAGRPEVALPLLTLRAVPAQAGPQQFRVFYRLTNGEEYTAETLPVTIQL